MSMLDSALAYAAENRERQLEELKTFLRIPSISVQAQKQPDVEAAARWLVNELDKFGMDRVETVSGHPMVYAERLRAPGKPTILFYGHYDVQTPGPLDAWDSDQLWTSAEYTVASQRMALKPSFLGRLPPKSACGWLPTKIPIQSISNCWRIWEKRVHQQ